VDLSLLKAVAVRVGQQENGFRHVANRPLGEARLIVVDERDDVAAGDVPAVDDHVTARIEREPDV
jgi:hypothetical protein